MTDVSATSDVDSVIITADLDRRSSRAPDYQAENQALTALAEAMSTNPGTVLQRLVEVAMQLTRSDSAGLSLQEPGGEIGTFRWVATAGAWSPYRDGTMPRDASPCGEVIAREAVLLMKNPERAFPALLQAEPGISEGLLAPFHLGGVAVGTVWTIKHGAGDHFEAEDARVLKSLARFASAAHQTVQALQRAETAGQRAEVRVQQLVTLADVSSEFFGTCDMEFMPIYGNAAAMRMVGLADLEQVKRTPLQEFFFPEDLAFITDEFFPRVLREGQAKVDIRFRHFVTGEPVWVDYSLVVLKDEMGRATGMGTVTHDLTERKRFELALRQSDRRQTFLLKLSDALRPLGDPREVQTAAMRVLCEHLAVNRAFYNEIDEERDAYVIHRAYANGLAPLTGHFRLSDFRWAAELAGSGQIVVFDDTSADPRLSEVERTSYAAMELAAGVGVPLIKDGRLVAGLVVHHATPRHWTPEDIELIRETAERTWAAVERAYAETALQSAAACDAFRVQLTDALRGAANAEEAQGAAMHVLGDHFQASRVMFGEGDEGSTETFTNHREYCRASAKPSLVGQHRWDAFGLYVETELLAGRTLVVDDVQTRPDHSPEHLAAYEAIGVQAYLAVPIVRQTRIMAYLAVNHTTPHTWTPDEIALAEETAERIWAAVGRARAEAKLRDSETRFRALATVGNSLVYRVSADWREMRLQVAGFVVDTEAPTTDWINIYIPPDERSRVREAVERAIEVKGLFELEHRVLRADGTVGWTFSRAIPLLDDAGEIVEWFGAANDVTKRVEADQSFTRMFRASPTPFLVMEPDAPRFTIRDVNDAYLAATMTTREGLVGRGVFDVFPDNPFDPTMEMSTVRASLERVLATREPDRLARIKFDIARSGGGFEERWWSPINSAVLDERGEVEAIIHNGNDVTEARRAETALRELNETLESRVADALAQRRLLADVIDGTDIFVQVADREFNWLAINEAAASEFARIFGVCRPRAGDNMLEMLEHRPDDRAAVEAIWSRALAGEEFVEVDQFGDPTLERRYYEMRFRTLRDADGRALGAYQFTSNVTERLLEQSRLTEAQEALRQAHKMEAIGNLTGGVAHDFNNLLTPIVGSLDLLQRRGVGGEREQRLIAGAIKSADRAKTLVHRLLAFARRQPLQATAVDLARLVRGMAELISSTTGPQIKVVVDAAENLPPANADPNQIEMAILNLAVNARDAMPEGGTLRISVDAETVGHQHRADLTPGRYLRLSVADTGEGMDEATLKRAVEPFFSTKGVGKGTGLGLSMAHGLASQLGGTLTIRSTRGIGTNIELWLPQSAEPFVGAELAADMPPAAQVNGTALLVDDEDLVRLSTADMLIELDYAVVEAASAEEALNLVARGLQPDLLVTDHLMPGMSGTELARVLRGSRPSVKVLIVSGYAEADGIAPELMRLTKPFRNADLAASLAALDRIHASVAPRP